MVNHQLTLISFNILAPIWLGPFTNNEYEWYPKVDLEVLDADYRINKIVEFVNKKKALTDIFGFQEVTPREFDILKCNLEPDFIGEMKSNAPHYWADSLYPPFAWKPNGEAIFIKKQKFKNIEFKDHALASTGNHCIEVSAKHKESNQKIRINNVHFDSDYSFNREAEALSLLNKVESNKDEYIDIIMGDMNTGIGLDRPIGLSFSNYNFVSILKEVNKEFHTHPWAPYLDDSSYDTAIDHIMVRNVLPVNGRVFSYKIWDYNNENKRIELTAKLLGSDHFPVRGVIEF